MRADAGASIGHGHRTRVEAIARTVLRLGGEVRLVSQPLIGGRPDPSDLPTTLWIPNTADAREDASLTLRVADGVGYRPVIAVVDSYLLGVEWEEAVASRGIFVVALDDFVGREHAANLVIELVPFTGNPDRASGLDLLPIDPAFGLPARPLPTSGWTVLISFGGSDPTDHTAIALDALDLVDRESPGLVSRALVTAGSESSRTHTLRARVEATQRRQWLGHVPSLVTFVDQSDVVITSAGNTLFEALAARKTIVAVVTSENQVVTATSLAADSSFICFEAANEATAETLTTALLDIPRRYEAGMCSALSESPIDTLGVDRLVALIKKRWETY